MLDKIIRTTAVLGQGHNDYRTGGYGFEEHKEFVSHVDTEGGFYDHQGRYNHHMKPAKHGRPHMSHMASCDEDSDVEEYFESRTHHSNNNNYHQQSPPLIFMPSPPMAQPYHNGQHADAYQGSHGMKHQGGHGMKHQGGYDMQHHGGHGMQHYGGHEMQHQGGHGMEHYGGHEMQHHGGHMSPPGHGMQQHGGHMSLPGRGSGRTVVVTTTENWKVDKMGKGGWGSKGL